MRHLPYYSGVGGIFYDKARNQTFEIRPTRGRLLFKSKDGKLYSVGLEYHFRTTRSNKRIRTVVIKDVKSFCIRLEGY